MVVDCEWAILKPFDRSKAQDLKVTEEKKKSRLNSMVKFVWF